MSSNFSPWNFFSCLVKSLFSCCWWMKLKSKLFTLICDVEHQHNFVKNIFLLSKIMMMMILMNLFLKMTMTFFLCFFVCSYHNHHHRYMNFILFWDEWTFLFSPAEGKSKSFSLYLNFLKKIVVVTEYFFIVYYLLISREILEKIREILLKLSKM